MDELVAKGLIESQGYSIDEIKFIPEGRNHYGFDVTLRDGKSLIARFERDFRISIDGKRRDPQYNGLLSLERESNLCSIVKNEAGLPTPEVYGIHRTEEGSFMLVEKLPGVHWKEFLEESNYSLNSYLRSLQFLGKDIAQVQQVHFESYGDVMSRDEVQPERITNFVDRLGMIIDLKLQRAEKSGALNKQQLDEIKKYFEQDFGYLEKNLKNSEDKPVLVLTDLHPMNFLVDNEGKPSGYFDLEFCQSGVPSLEFYVFKFGLFNYFDTATFQKAKDIFFKGFEDNGGVYNRDDPTNIKLETTLSVGHLLSAVASYHGAKDGMRDKWSEQFRKIMFDAIQSNNIDYAAIADVSRSKTKQPKKPNFP